MGSENDFVFKVFVFPCRHRVLEARHDGLDHERHRVFIQRKRIKRRRTKANRKTELTENLITAEINIDFGSEMHLIFDQSFFQQELCTQRFFLGTLGALSYISKIFSESI